jgi:hypothetical protein
MRKYNLLHPAKTSRIGIDTEDVLYVFDVESGRYLKLENINIKQNERY